MIILGGFPSGIVFGPHGITPNQIATGGNADSPLLNDVDPGDETTEILWRIEAPYLQVGTTLTSDAGSYRLLGAPDGTHTQPYRLYSLPVTGSPTVTNATIVTVVGSAVVAPTINVQPQAVTATEGQPATFMVATLGTAPITYQWRRNGADILGATAASYTLGAVALVDSGGVFSVVATNSGGSVTSSGAVLTVQAQAFAPTITLQPVPQSALDGAPATFTVVATGTAPIAYQWRRNGVSIGGANAASYQLTAALVDNGAVFSVLVSNAHGSMLSASVALSVTANASRPTITVQPLNAVVDDGSSATFSVVATGATPITYQWARNGLPVAGATSASLTVAGVDLQDNRATFQVTATNAFGSTVSRRAELLVPVISVADARSAARIDDDRFDNQIPRWIDAAARMAEQFCNRYFTPRAPIFERTTWPAVGETFPLREVRECAVSYWNGAAWVALPAEEVLVFSDGSRTGIAPVSSTWPALGEIAAGPRVRLSFAAGPTSSASLPVEVQHFVLAHVSLFADENRAAAPQATQNFPWLYAGLEPLKVY